eukprot:15436853-Alexandrium_andersonii.AAC.1
MANALLHSDWNTAFWKFQSPEHSVLNYESTALCSALRGPALCALRPFQLPEHSVWATLALKPGQMAE